MNQNNNDRRALLGGDYVHIDVSGQFSDGAKWIVTIVWLVSMSLILVAPGRIILKGWLALSCALLMICLRSVLRFFYVGPYFNVGRAVPLEPAVFLFAMMVLKTSLLSYYTPFVTKIQTLALGKAYGTYSATSRSNIASVQFLKTFVLSALASAALTQDTTISLLNPSTLNNAMSYADWIVQMAIVSAAALGSTVTLTGTINAILIVTVAYDNIGWVEFLSNIFLPVLAGMVALYMALVILNQYGTTSAATSTAQYSNIPAEQVSVEFGTVATKEDSVEISTFENTDSADLETEEQSCTSSTSTSNNEEDHAVASSVQPPIPVGVTSCRIPLILIIIMVASFAVGLSVLVIGLGIALIVFWIGHASSGMVDSDNESDAILSKLEYSKLLEYVGVVILTASWADTGVPQTLLNRVLGDCADSIAWSSCVYKWVAINLVFGLIASPLSMIIVSMATFPYASPYEWMQFTLAVSMAGLARSILSSGCPYKRMLMALVVCIVFALMAGTFFLSVIHTVPECSIRLGECDEDW